MVIGRRGAALDVVTNANDAARHRTVVMILMRIMCLRCERDVRHSRLQCFAWPHPLNSRNRVATVFRMHKCQSQESSHRSHQCASFATYVAILGQGTDQEIDPSSHHPFVIRLSSLVLSFDLFSDVLVVPFIPLDSHRVI